MSEHHGASGSELLETIDMGETKLTPDEVHKLIWKFYLKYPKREYQLLNNNTQHFTKDFAKELTGRDIPSNMNRITCCLNFWCCNCCCWSYEFKHARVSQGTWETYL